MHSTADAATINTNNAMESQCVHMVRVSRPHPASTSAYWAEVEVCLPRALGGGGGGVVSTSIPSTPCANSTPAIMKTTRAVSAAGSSCQASTSTTSTSARSLTPT